MTHDQAQAQEQQQQAGAQAAAGQQEQAQDGQQAQQGGGGQADTTDGLAGKKPEDLTPEELRLMADTMPGEGPGD